MKLASWWIIVSSTLSVTVTQWDSILHSESDGFRRESHWCARSGFGTWPNYEIGDFGWPSGRTWNSLVFNIGRVRLPPCHQAKVGLRGAKWLKKKVCFSDFIAVFDKQVNIYSSIASISRPISSRNYNGSD